VATNGEEELVLSRSQTGLACLLFAPPLEVPETGPQGEQAPIGVV
jgi:hypothetical protein